MRFIKDSKFWGGVVTGVVVCYVYHNYVRKRMG